MQKPLIIEIIPAQDFREAQNDMCAYTGITKLCSGSSYFWDASPSNYFTVQMIRKRSRLQQRSPNCCV